MDLQRAGGTFINDAMYRSGQILWCLDPWKKVRGSDGRMELASKCVALEVADMRWTRTLLVKVAKCAYMGTILGFVSCVRYSF